MIGDRNLVGLVNNAGIVVSGPLLYLRPSEYRRQLDVNMISPLVVIQAFAPLLGTDKKRQGPAGRIVNITSSGAKVPIPLLGAYSASKSGLEGMSDVLRLELMLFGIDLVMIEPGFVNTTMYDKGEKEDLSEFKPTEYWNAVQNFQKFIVAEGRKGFSPERLGEAVHLALSTAKPKARYAVIKQRFKNWTLPRLLPARMLDAVVAKQLGFISQKTREKPPEEGATALRPTDFESAASAIPPLRRGLDSTRGAALAKALLGGRCVSKLKARRKGRPIRETIQGAIPRATICPAFPKTRRLPTRNRHPGAFRF
jgi:short-subunit dehydrogenase